MATAKTTKRSLPGLFARRRGIVLIAVLLVVAILSLAAYQYADLMLSEYKASENAVRWSQARLAAESGVHYTAALMGDVANAPANPYGDNPIFFKDIVVNANEASRYNARFWVVSPPDDPTLSVTPRSGVADEAGRINVNGVMRLDPSGKTLYNLLMKLPNMTSDVAASIVQWLGPNVSPFTASDGTTGADDTYYLGQSPPYKSKNGPIDSLEELLLVRGVTPGLLFGTDTNRNGIQDAGEGVGGDGTFDRGWAQYLTVYSREPNKDSTGVARLYLNDPNTQTLYANLGEAIDADMATFIMLVRAYGLASNTTSATISTGSGGTLSIQIQNNNNNNKVTIGDLSSVSADMLKLTDGTTTSSSTSGTGGGGGATQNTISSVYDLIGASVQVQSSDPKEGMIQFNSPLNDANKLATILPALLDKTTTTQDLELQGRININTCSETVLRTLPGLSETDFQMILSQRQNLMNADAPDPVFKSPVWLMSNASLTSAKMKSLEKYVTTYTQVCRFQVIGYFDGGGPKVRIEAVVDINFGSPRILMQRDISELGNGFDVQKQQ